MFFSEYDFLLIPVIIITLWAQLQVTSRYKKYSQVMNARHMTGFDAARRILDQNGLTAIRIEHISGQLTDHYDPKAGVIRLSDGVYNSPSVAAVGIAAHEAGHAVQYACGYFPIRIRNAVIPVTQIASKAAIPILLAGFIFSIEPLVNIGIILYSAMLVFQMITLPVEFNASRRAVRIIGDSDYLSAEELKGVKKVLTAAAMTYVAAMLSTLVQILRFIGMANGGRRRR
ncbi:MAG: zinc metallopeptidase [Clostridia bacterium]|nr:zinc metallopeptidase [Clostridia bacterium]